jgi:hypothetical protein
MLCCIVVSIVEVDVAVCRGLGGFVVVVASAVVKRRGVGGMFWLVMAVDAPGPVDAPSLLSPAPSWVAMPDVG